MSEIQHEWLAPYFSKDSRRGFLSLAGKVSAMGALAAGGVAQAQTTPPASDLAVLNYALTLEYLEATFYAYFLGVGAIPASSLPTGVNAPSSYSGVLGTVGRVSPTDASRTPGSGSGPFVSGVVNSSTLLGTGLNSTLGVGSNLLSLMQQIRDHEIIHVIVLQQTIQALGGTPVQPCDYVFPITTFDQFLKTAQALENTGVSAYDGAISMVRTPAIAQAGATIATVEARHAGFLNLLAGGGLQASNNFQPSTATPPAGTPPGVSASPFPSAFDTPLTMAQVLAIAKPFLGSSCSTS